MALVSLSEVAAHLSTTTKRTHYLLLLPSQPFQPTRLQFTAFATMSQPKTTRCLRVAYQGAPGAYSELAAKTACPRCTAVPFRSFVDAFKAVEEGHVDCTILPVESTMGVNAVRNYHLLLQHNLQIVQEISLFVHYCLVAMPGVRRWELKKVISHPMALAHCGQSLALLGLEGEPVEDTAGAVELLCSHQMLDTAAIASSRAAHLYGLDVLAHGLQDESWNVTRFLILSKDTYVPQKSQFGRLKTSLVMAHHGNRGTLTVLLRVLSAFSSRNINLTKLELSPNPKGHGPAKILDVHGSGSLEEFPHSLYIDFEGSMEDHKVKDAIDELSSLSVFVRVLGSYPADPNIYDLH